MGSSSLSDQSGSNHFCYLYIQEQAEAWTCVPLFIIGLCLLVFSILQYRRNKKLDKINTIIHLTFISIFVSLVAYLLKLVLSEVVFWIEHFNTYNSDFNSNYLTASKFQFFLDNIGVFSMQSTVLLVPVNWFRNIYYIFKKWSQKDDVTEYQRQQLLKSAAFQNRIYYILLVYGIIRFGLLFGLLIPFAIVTSLDALSILADIVLIWWLVESAFLLAMLILGMISLVRNTKLQQILQQKDYKLMKRHYGLLMICTSLRLLSDLAFVIAYLQYVRNNTICYVEPDSKMTAFYIVNILLEGFLTFYMSVFFILQIYKTNPKDVKKNANLKSVIQVHGEIKQVNTDNREVFLENDN